MKNTIKLALVASMILSTSSAFATNGDIMIGQSAESRSMGGVGIATSFGAASGLSNPALINTVEDKEVTGALTFFMPSVDFASNASANSQSIPNSNDISSADSVADFSVIPEIAFANRVNDNFVYGISMTGVAGMGTDYSDEAFGTTTDNGAFNMKTELQIMKIAVPLSYEKSGLTLGIAPILQYGSLQMSHMIDTSAQGVAPVPSDFVSLSNGASSDIGFGFELGMAYNFKDYKVKGLTAGLVYKSKIKMEYDDVIGDSIAAFGLSNSILSGDKLDQPAEFGVGLSYSIAEHTVAFDYRNIAWSDTDGYGDFGWEDQNVFALGYEYAISGWALRAGYNYAKNPIVEQDGSKGITNPALGADNYAGAVRNFFNMSGFPGIVESHITFGGGYTVSDALTIDAAFVYAPEVSVSYDTSAMTEAFVMGAGGTPANATAAAESSADVSHSQMGLTIAASYRF